VHLLDLLGQHATRFRAGWQRNVHRAGATRSADTRGDVRQGGTLAAVVALNRIEELAVDHEKAAKLACGLADLGWAVNQPETNIVLATVPDVARTLSTLRDHGVLASSLPKSLGGTYAW
jgi:hypothetical protein